MRGIAGRLVYALRRSSPTDYSLPLTAEPLITRSVRSLVWEGDPARGVPIPMALFLSPGSGYLLQPPSVTLLAIQAARMDGAEAVLTASVPRFVTWYFAPSSCLLRCLATTQSPYHATPQPYNLHYLLTI
jgi:hypothetical protein